MAALAFALHILGAVVWVGGMFAIYVCLRPALVTLEPPQRLRLMRVTFQKFFPWVWTAILLLLASGAFCRRRAARFVLRCARVAGPVGAVGIDVERPRGTLDNLFRDHDLLDAFEAR